MVAAFSLTILLFASTIAAKPVVEQNSLVKLSLTRRSNLTAAYNPAKHDQQRIKALNGNTVVDKNLQDRDGINTPVVNQALFYSASVGVGCPATNYTLLIDTGSTVTWVGGNKAYVKTKTSYETSNKVPLIYGVGSLNGTVFIDQVTIAPNLVIPSQPIVVADQLSDPDDFSGIDGILAIGLTIKDSIPTVTDNLFSMNEIQGDLVSIFFAPFNSPQSDGELTWGGINTEKVIGPITYTPVTSDRYWSIDASIKFGETVIQPSSSGIVDSGTSLIILSDDAFNAYKDASGAVFDSNAGLFSITSDQYKKLESLHISVSGVVFELVPNAQIWPRNLNIAIGGVASKIYLIIVSFEGLSFIPGSFIFGMGFFERFIVVFDTANNQIGLGITPFTSAISN